MKSQEKLFHFEPDDPSTERHSPKDDLRAEFEGGREGFPREGLLHKLRPALAAHPKDPELLMMAALAALLENRPDQSLIYQKRYTKHFVRDIGSHTLNAIALAQKGSWYLASNIIEKHHLKACLPYLKYYLAGATAFTPWVRGWFKQVENEMKRRGFASQKSGRTSATRRLEPAKPAIARASQPGAIKNTLESAAQADDGLTGIPALPRLAPRVAASFVLPEVQRVPLPETGGDLAWFRLRSQLARLSLYQGFDELLCIPTLRNVTSFWYQIETVRKVLKQFRGRVLLADEVGLGKTIEAGMVLKEYMLRGMAERVLILTPASMVGQWLEEMSTKFCLSFASTYDTMIRRDPAAFWRLPRVIASIALARRPEHFALLARQTYDLVIVDEAHHLKNRASTNWKLVDALQKRFLLLLSATPVQNSLIELYNLLTLLKPGVFKTEKEFRSTYMAAGKPRVPANRDQMRDLMRDVMIRNTRSQVEVRLPPRTAVTLRVDPLPEEAACYGELSELVAEFCRGGQSHQRLTLRHLLASAGSSPAAAAVAIERFVGSHNPAGKWSELRDRYRSIPASAKENALVDLLKRNPDEKKIVFVRNLETLHRLDFLFRGAGLKFDRSTGSMTGPEKDQAIERFRQEVPLLLSTESGGEGRNLQFSNTLINFDLPWNPMAIEQRIGRLHRIGQTRQVFIFNLAVRNTLEDHLIRILDEKINMFELVVGEIGAILGEMEDAHEFPELIFSAWVESTEQERQSAFDRLGAQLADARRQYEGIKNLDEHLFGDEFVAG